MTELEFAEHFPVDETIPSAILAKIIDKELKLYSWAMARWRYYPYYELQGGMLAIATVGVKNKKNRRGDIVGRYIKKFTVHVIGREYAYIRDIDYKCMAGYLPVFGGLNKHRGESNIVNDYTWGRWCSVHSNLFRVYNNGDILNPEFLKTLDAFKYCAFDGTTDAFDYLSAYMVCPKMELVSKMLTSNYAASVRILKKVDKDKKFIAWLKANRDEIIKTTPKIPDLIKAYNRKWTISRARLDTDYKAHFKSYSAPKKGAEDTFLRERSPLQWLYSHAEKAMRDRLTEYLARNIINIESYSDYIKAIDALGLDLNDTKNLFPMDYKYWHDMRMDQYASKKAEIDKEKAAELDKQMKAVVDTYSALAGKEADGLVVIAAVCKKDLIREGEFLHHCVGRMNYDQRIAKGESLIFFVRHAAEPDTPFVTVEFSLSLGKVMQCYGDHDSRPEKPVLDFVYGKWQTRAKRELDRINQKAAKLAAMAI